MLLKFNDPTLLPHRPPRKTVKSPYSVVLAPKRQLSRVLEAGIHGAASEYEFGSMLWCPGRRPPQGNARSRTDVVAPFGRLP